MLAYLTVVVRENNVTTGQCCRDSDTIRITMFSTFTNYFWGGSEEELSAGEAVPRAQEVEDWIVVGDKPKDFQDSKEKSKRPSQRNNPSSKQRLQSLMFGDGSSSKAGSWNRPTTSGEKNQMYKQNFSIKMAGNRNLKQC